MIINLVRFKWIINYPHITNRYCIWGTIIDKLTEGFSKDKWIARDLMHNQFDQDFIAHYWKLHMVKVTATGYIPPPFMRFLSGSIFAYPNERTLILTTLFYTSFLSFSLYYRIFSTLYVFRLLIHLFLCMHYIRYGSK